MALTQFNAFDPKLAGLEGNMQAEPRVFAHDAVSVTIGAINNSDSNNGITISAGGADYTVDDTLDQTGATSPAGGTGFTCTVTSVDGSGAITGVEITLVGSVYAIDNIITLGNVVVADAGATGGTITVKNIDIPNTQRRGCCIYSGASQAVQVELESGNTVSFVGVNAGSFLPILVKRLLVGTDIIALY